jgi:hypothetical protein
VTRTSTDRRLARGERRFRRSLLAVVVVLAVLCAGFGVIAALQGPRLSSTQVDELAVVERSGQQLRMFANQAVAQIDDSQVTVEPQAPFSVLVEGDVIAVTFGAALRYATTYTVTVDGVTSPYVANRSSLTTSFTTGSPDLWVLDRGSPDDVIVRSTLAGDRQVVFTGHGIQSFAVLKDALAVAAFGPGLVSTLTIASLDGLYQEELRIPPESGLRGLAIDPGRTVLGFQVTSLAGAGQGAASSGPEFGPDTLFTVDLEAGRSVLPVTGLDGAPLRVLRWEFVPGGGILALDVEGMLTFVGADGVAAPLGRFGELGALSADGTEVVVSEAGDAIVLTLADGARQPLELETPDGRTPLLGSARLLADGSVVALAVRAASSVVTSSLLVVDGSDTREAFSITGGLIVNFTVSPNGQLAALAVVPDVSASQSDGYGAEAMSTSVVTVVVDLANGEEVTRMDGFALQW